MRKKHSFLLTILPGDDPMEAIRGRLEVISTGKTSVFFTLEELIQLIGLETKSESEYCKESPENYSVNKG